MQSIPLIAMIINYNNNSSDDDWCWIDDSDVSDEDDKVGTDFILTK